MLSFDGIVYAGLYYATLALTAWALVDALIRPAAAYVAAGKLTKPGWAAISRRSSCATGSPPRPGSTSRPR